MTSLYRKYERTSLDRHECKLQLHWLVQLYSINHLNNIQTNLCLDESKADQTLLSKSDQDRTEQ